MVTERSFKLRLRLAGSQGIIMGPGRADLLTLIAATGSIAAAGRQMGMSYKRAWNLVVSMNKTFATPLVETSKGGTDHGGAHLTPLGQELLAAYRNLEIITLTAGQKTLDQFETAMPPSVRPNPT
jgi:molybdate transport system regulatory protein